MKRVGFEARFQSGLTEIQVVDSVEVLCYRCFYGNKNFRRITFGESSSLKLIGKEVFDNCWLKYIHVPNGVEELHDDCFSSAQAFLVLHLGSTLNSSRLASVHFVDAI